MAAETYTTPWDVTDLSEGRCSYTISRGTTRLHGNNAPQTPRHEPKSLATRSP